MSKEKFNQVWDDVMTIATEEEMRLVCNINGKSIASLESIIYARVGYRTHDQWMEMEGDDEQTSNVIFGVDFSDSINKLNQL